MICCVGSVKGGVGKSTIASNLAAVLSENASVLLIDADAQGTSALFAEARASRLGSSGYACVRAQNLEVRTQVTAMAQKFDHIIVDAGGQMNDALRAALSVCDLVLAPVPPRSVDLWAVDDLMRMAEASRTTNPNLKAGFVVNLAYPRGKDNHAALDHLRSSSKAPLVAPVPLVARKAWSDSFGFGRSVNERPKDPKASYEFTALIEAMRSWGMLPW